MILISIIVVAFILKFGIGVIIFLFSLFKNNPKELTSQLAIIPKPIISTPFFSTSSAQINIFARSFVDGQISFFVNGKKVLTNQIEKNKDLIVTLNLHEGTNSIYAVVSDQKLKKFSNSDTLQIEVKNTPPFLEVEYPLNGSTFSGKNQSEIEIKGKTDEDCAVRINNRQVILQKDGKFNYRYYLLEGENKLSIIAEDKVGNKTEKEITVFYTP